MKALSLIQPWATLLLSGAKRYETRAYRTHHRGRLLICSSLKRDPIYRAIAAEPLLAEALKNAGFEDFDELPRGFLVGSVEITNCYPTHDMPAIGSSERAFGDFTAGRYAWECADPRILATPIPVRGLPGLFSFRHDVPHELV